MYTSHGYHIPGTDVETPLPSKAQCGGLGMCRECSIEARAATTLNVGNQVYNNDILRYFEYEHLSEKLQAVSKMFCIVAKTIDETLPKCPETSVALRKLLEAKDAAVRAALDT